MVKGESEGSGLALVQCIDREPPLKERTEALWSAYLHWATVGSVQEGHDVGKKEKDRDSVAADE